MSITEETRREAYIARPITRANKILEIIGDDEMTAREIARRLGYHDLNAVKPRITELKKLGLLVAVGKSKDMLTGRNTAVYRRT